MTGCVVTGRKTAHACFSHFGRSPPPAPFSATVTQGKAAHVHALVTGEKDERDMITMHEERKENNAADGQNAWEVGKKEMLKNTKGSNVLRSRCCACGGRARGTQEW
jgi:hypothetical protein